MGTPQTRVPERSWLAEHLLELAPGARRRLKWMDYYDTQGRNARRTCRHFDISPQTFYRWRRRYSRHDLTTLEERSRAPGRCRQPIWPPTLAEAARRLRTTSPRWGKDKLVVLRRREGWTVSTSMGGRILRRLRTRGVLVEPPRRAVSARKARALRPYAIRKPKDYAVTRPGDLVEVDTLDVRPLPGVLLKQFTARDLISRWEVVERFSRAPARTAAAFLDALQARMPFAVRAIQVDGGSEFAAEFEAECARRGIRLFVLPPRSPKLNGHVERAQRTHTEEFYEVTELEWTAEAIRRPLRRWEHLYNTVRPHQALGYRTPHQFLRDLARAG